MSATAKVAVSIPSETFEALERERRHAGASRSKIVTLAIEAWIRQRAVEEADRRYVEAYQRQPERVDEVAAVAKAVVSSWERWK